MKIGILTLYYKNRNYGGLLQAYALQKVLNQYAYSEQICFDFSYNNCKLQKKCQKEEKKQKDYIEKVLRKIISKIEKTPFLVRYIKNKCRIREEKFDEFINFIPHSSQVYDIKNIEQTKYNYDIFITGSDQIWSNWLSDEALNVFSLAFIKEIKRKYSYAASLGCKQISENHLNILKKNLSVYKTISVRERSAKQMLENILDKKEIKTVVDPVLLLDKIEWNKIANPVLVKDEYIFCYFLGEKKNHRKMAKKIAKILHLKIVFIPYITHNRFKFADLGFGDFREYDIGPKEFLDLIKSSKLILTDSFHAILFASIYHKNFYVFNRDDDKDINSMNDRIIDFLRERRLENCLIDKNNYLNRNYAEKIDYTFSDKVTDLLRQNSIEYIRSIFEE